MDNFIKKKVKVRDGFSNKFGLFMATFGAAVGLGNIWRFPYLVGNNGGGVFILIYIFLSILIGIPLLITEFTIGRKARRNVVTSIETISENTKWNFVGWTSIVTSFIVSVIYFIISGWVLYYFILSVFGKLPNENSEVFFNDFISSPLTPLVVVITFGFVISGILFGGIKNGIERFSKIFMPILLISFIAVIFRSLTLEGAADGLRYIFIMDWEKIKELDVWRAALGQAFFSITLGVAVMVTYGSYTKKKENISLLSFQVVMGDNFVSILATLAVIPAVFAFGLNPEQGFSLLFVTIPRVFAQMAGGWLFSVLFFSSVLIAAISSAISVLEAMVVTFSEKTKYSREQCLLTITTIIIITGTFASLSLTDFGKWLVFGGVDLFTFLDQITSQILFFLSSLLLVLFTVVVMKKNKYVKENSLNQTIHTKRIAIISYYSTVYIASFALFVLLFNGFTTFIKLWN